jgi:hypothetical protein
MGACSGFAGSSGGLRGAAYAPLTAPRPAPRFTVHKNFSLQEQVRSAVALASGPGASRPVSGRLHTAAVPVRHIRPFLRLIMIWVTLIGSYHNMLTRLAMVWVQRTQRPVET